MGYGGFSRRVITRGLCSELRMVDTVGELIWRKSSSIEIHLLPQGSNKRNSKHTLHM